MLYLPPPPPPHEVFARYGGPAIVQHVDHFAKYDGFRLPEAGEYTIQFHEKLAPLFQPSRYKVLEGGRGSMKSWGVARALLIKSLMSPLRILCAREYQNSIADSVHKLLADQIESMGLSPWFKVNKTSIRSTNGSEFIFVGLGDLAVSSNRTKIKSYEAVDICWIEEAEGITKRTWEILIPTIRKTGSEIWIVYNPNLDTDDTYQRFHVNPPEGVDSRGNPITIRIVLNWRENPWMSEAMKIEKDHIFRTDADSAAHVWDGHLREHSQAAIFGGKCKVWAFPAPDVEPRYFHGADWGFSQDPTILLRCYMTGEGNDLELWIDQEAWGIGVDFVNYDAGKLILCQDQMSPNSRPGLFEKIPSAKRWPIKADGARPETISYVRTVGGYNISAAEKWPGSIEDGITHLRGFKQINIHTRCTHTADDFKLYSYKVDKITGDVLPIIVDKFNHAPDAVRYALDGFITRRGAAGIWAKLGKR